MKTIANPMNNGVPLAEIEVSVTFPQLKNLSVGWIEAALLHIKQGGTVLTGFEKSGILNVWSTSSKQKAKKTLIDNGDVLYEYNDVALEPKMWTDYTPTPSRREARKMASDKAKKMNNIPTTRPVSLGKC